MKQEGTKDIEGQLRGIPDGGISIIRHSKAEGECTLLTEQFQGQTIGKDRRAVDFRLQGQVLLPA